MNLVKYLNEDLVRVQMAATTKEEAISSLASLVGSLPAVTDYDMLLKDIHAREKVGTTGIGGGVAIPHARTDAVSEFVVSLGIAANGIDFDAIDGQPVRLIFLMGIPKDRVQEYLKRLAHMNRVLKTPGVTEDLLAAQDAGAVLEIFERHQL